MLLSLPALGDLASSGGIVLPRPPVLPEIRPGTWEDLKPFQRRGVPRLVGWRRGHLWWTTGSGKTRAAIIIALAEPGPIVVLTRASTRGQWLAEFRSISTVDPYVVLPEGETPVGYPSLGVYLRDYGYPRNPTNALRGLNRTGRVVIIASWGALLNDSFYDICRTLLNGMTLIGDEVHNIRNHRHYDPEPIPGTTKFKFVQRRTIAARARFLSDYASRRYGLTATPIYNFYRDLWAQFQFVEPGAVGRYHEWAIRFCDGHEEDGFFVDNGVSNVNALWDYASGRVDIVSYDELKLYLPALTRITTQLTAADLEPARAVTTKAFQDASRALAKSVARGEGADDLTEAYLDAQSTRAASRKSKYAGRRAAELVGEGKRVLVLAATHDDVDRIAMYARRALEESWPSTRAGPGAGWQLWVGDGRDTPSARAVLQEQFLAHQSGGALIGTVDAWGEAYNLHNAHWGIAPKLPWTWGQIRQLEGRGHRLGGRLPMTWEYVFDDSDGDRNLMAKVYGKIDNIAKMLSDSQLLGVQDTIRGGTVDDVVESFFDRLLAGDLSELAGL